MNKQLLLICLTLLTLSSCKKSLLTGGEDCNALNNLHITSNTPVLIGGNIKFSVPEVGGYRIYSWRGPNNYTSQETGDSITYAELKYEGWYYVHISKPDCNNSYTDSVYIDVKLNQGNPSCTETANTCRYNNLFDDNFSSVSREINSSTGYLSIDATAFGSGEMTIFFHPEWLTKEPEDGIYTTTNVPSFEQLDANYNKVFISAIKQSIYFACQQNQQVYISHVNGKLQVRFCSLVMSGSNGSSSFITNASGNLVAQ